MIWYQNGASGDVVICRLGKAAGSKLITGGGPFSSDSTSRYSTSYDRSPFRRRPPSPVLHLRVLREPTHCRLPLPRARYVRRPVSRHCREMCKSTKTIGDNTREKEKLRRDRRVARAQAGFSIIGRILKRSQATITSPLEIAPFELPLVLYKTSRLHLALTEIYFCFLKRS